MWRGGYSDGDLLGHIYDDAYNCMKEWVNVGIKVYIYSSGSIEAQKLIFGYTNHGSLLNLITGHFDTTIGMKQDPNSYHNIIKAIGIKDPKRLLFLTDVPEEAEAAIEVGAESWIVIREGNAKIKQNSNLHQIRSFNEVIYK